MGNYTFSIGNHPAQERLPFSNKPKFDDDGNPVPLFPDQKCLRLDGQLIAYITKGGLQFVVSRQELGSTYQEAVDFVESTIGEQPSIGAVPYMKDIDANEFES